MSRRKRTVGIFRIKSYKNKLKMLQATLIFAAMTAALLMLFTLGMENSKEKTNQDDERE